MSKGSANFCVMVWAATALCRAAPGDPMLALGQAAKSMSRHSWRLPTPTAGRLLAAGRQDVGRLLVGHRRKQQNLFLLVRFTPGGAVDTSFGNNGVVSTMIGAAPPRHLGSLCSRMGKSWSLAAASPSAPLTQPSSVFRGTCRTAHLIPAST